eukprot:14255169-Ditylum_brightwellii.AAC.1
MGNNSVPKFIIYVESKKYGAMHARVEALVVIIQCTVENAPYIKTLISAVYEQSLIKVGTFVPQGFHRMAGEEEYKDKLRKHNAYVESATSVNFFGLSKDALYSNVTIEDEHMFCETYVNH